jgi:hypothetical protein
MSVFAAISIFVFLIGAPILTAIFFLKVIQKGRVEKEDARSWLQAISALFWGMG